ncbi:MULTISPECIES: BON domain-containing protein [Paraburkholderia]|uniref:Osmotically-inducible protein OsmY n=1 Tax=Paraburkholderia silvatlantica TaxID=321895 RepID=A0ABR6FKG8_9BURK|nr:MULTISPECIES: BON domain-containing protein [Paraburkholderia]MBB2927916.1 osmotically-inducible protein OsmY [Paraburkholderia silvatlantica]PVY27521.1 BON domain-containing protein [Paraburkholderia silvatlantica]PXW34494.1 BON domain-containing protein [Paraburkholderia silvatlantica]
MKSIQARALAVATLILAASSNAWSQPGQTASVPAGMPAASIAESATPPINARKADRALRRQVYAAIGKHKEISAGNISIVARSGAVTLSGTVMNASQVNEVAEIAKGVPGVTSVTNKLTVQKPFGGA